MAFICSILCAYDEINRRNILKLVELNTKDRAIGIFSKMNST